MVLDKLGVDEQMLNLTDRLRERRGVKPASEFQLIPGVQEMILILGERFKLGLVTTRGRYHIDKFQDNCFYLCFSEITLLQFREL